MKTQSILVLATVVFIMGGLGQNNNLFASMMYWTDTISDKIQRANLDGSGVTDLVVIRPSNLYGIDLDVLGGKMYWTDGFNEKIQRANLDGSNVEDLIITNLSVPYGIAVDAVNRKLYWADSLTGKIQRANLDGSYVENVITGISVPKYIALDVAGGKIYWTSYTKIQRANLDGSKVEDIVTYAHWGPEGIALDLYSGRMYWMDDYSNIIRTANLDGSGVTDLVTTGLTSPIGIALDLASDRMIWTDVDAGKIKVANLDGSGVRNLVTGIHPFGIAISPKLPTIYYVDGDATGANNGSSWEHAYNYLQDALAAAASRDEIWVAQGIYKPDQGVTVTPGDREATFQLKNGVAIYGGYAGFGAPDPNEQDVELYETILSGDLNGDDVDVNDPCDLLNEPTRAENSYHVVKGSRTDATAVLDGFTITAGNNDYEAPVPPTGGGMLNREGSPTVRNCTFSSNRALALGYGMGGGMYNYNSSATIINCTFTGNTSRSGGGMYNRNWRSNNKTVVVNCTFIGNYAKGKGGGVWNYTSSPIITNCIFSGNSAGDGGGMFNNFNCTPMVSNCTFTGNIAVKDGGGICNENNPYYGDSTPIVTNCILWNNSDSGGTDESAQIYGGIPTVNYNCIQGWTGALGGTGNIDADPCFIKPGYWVDANDPNIVVEPNDPNAIWIDGDYHLLPDSPCIDAGDPNYIPEPNETDLDGNPRVNGGRIDMGAYESIMHEARLLIWPRVINRKSRQPRIMAWLHLPQGITKDQIDKDVPLILYPGGIKAIRQFAFQNRRRGTRRTSIFAFFDKAELMDAVPDNGTVQLQVFGHLLEPGQYFYGSDTIRIIARRLPHRRR